MEYKVIKIPNGDVMVDFYIYRCTKCGKEISECNPYIIDNDNCYCGDCAFIEDIIDVETLKKDFYYFIDYELLGEPIIINNKVEWFSKSYIKRKNTNLERRTPEYTKWRKSVYERDNYTCKICGQKGGNLNAHHIEHFADNKAKRIDVNNGITLCEKCHKKLHREKSKENG